MVYQRLPVTVEKIESDGKERSGLDLGRWHVVGLDGALVEQILDKMEQMTNLNQPVNTPVGYVKVEFDMGEDDLQAKFEEFDIYQNFRSKKYSGKVQSRSAFNV